jgi:hypothetical protein
LLDRRSRVHFYTKVWRPQLELQTGIKEMIAYYQSNVRLSGQSSHLLLARSARRSFRGAATAWHTFLAEAMGWAHRAASAFTPSSCWFVQPGVREEERT